MTFAEEWQPPFNDLEEWQDSQYIASYALHLTHCILQITQLTGNDVMATVSVIIVKTQT